MSIRRNRPEDIPLRSRGEYNYGIDIIVLVFAFASLM